MKATPPLTVPDVVPSAVRGGTRGGGRGGGQGGQANPPKVFTPKKVVFTGEVEGMEGKVFDLSPTDGTKQVVNYEDTLNKLKKYVGNHFDNREHVTRSIDQMERVAIPLPEDLPEGASAAATRAWTKKINVAVTNDDKLTRNIERLFSVIMSQCCEGLLTKVKEQIAWKEVEE